MNLIICCTPLQVLIAEKIIEQHPNEPFYGIMLSTVSNKKFDYYKQRLADKCVEFFAMVQETQRLKLFKQILQLKRRFGGKSFHKAFVANINELQIQFILSAIQFNQLNTFDDGTANIIPGSIFYTNNPDSLNRKLINRLLGNKYSIDSLKRQSSNHYTIYPELPNIVEPVTAVNLVKPISGNVQSDEVTNILLGQPVFQDDQKNIALAKQVIERFNIHAYLPHPREKYKLDNVRYIDTNLIFEDYITQEFADKKCRIYTYFSSAVLNIMNKSDNIEVVALRIDVSEPSYVACYNLLENVGVNIIDIRA
ncbi:glycosyltransferase family 52 [Glaesserella sp.]|uniref:glycosyltransferase family 52 n=1 Tax=Glaesserella sp. TaxID=2094731 RepID=UPI0035A13320